MLSKKSKEDRASERVCFGVVLRQEREQADKTMGDLARFLGVSVAYISDVERSKQSPFSPDTCKKVEEFLGLERGVLERAMTTTENVDARVAGHRTPEEVVASLHSAICWSCPDTFAKQCDAAQECFRVPPEMSREMWWAKKTAQARIEAEKKV